MSARSATPRLPDPCRVGRIRQELEHCSTLPLIVMPRQLGSALAASLVNVLVQEIHAREGKAQHHYRDGNDEQEQSMLGEITTASVIGYLRIRYRAAAGRP